MAVLKNFTFNVWGCRSKCLLVYIFFHPFFFFCFNSVAANHFCDCFSFSFLFLFCCWDCDWTGHGRQDALQLSEFFCPTCISEGNVPSEEQLQYQNLSASFRPDTSSCEVETITETKGAVTILGSESVHSTEWEMTTADDLFKMPVEPMSPPSPWAEKQTVSNEDIKPSRPSDILQHLEFHFDDKNSHQNLHFPPQIDLKSEQLINETDYNDAQQMRNNGYPSVVHPQSEMQQQSFETTTSQWQTPAQPYQPRESASNIVTSQTISQTLPTSNRFTSTHISRRVAPPSRRLMHRPSPIVIPPISTQPAVQIQQQPQISPAMNTVVQQQQGSNVFTHYTQPPSSYQEQQLPSQQYDAFASSILTAPPTNQPYKPQQTSSDGGLSSFDNSSWEQFPQQSQQAFFGNRIPMQSPAPVQPSLSQAPFIYTNSTGISTMSSLQMQPSNIRPYVPPPPHPLISFTQDGRVVVMYPRRPRRLNVLMKGGASPVSDQGNLEEDENTKDLKPGCVRVHSLTNLLKNTTYVQSLLRYPGPLSSSLCTVDVDNYINWIVSESSSTKNNNNATVSQDELLLWRTLKLYVDCAMVGKVEAEGKNTSSSSASPTSPSSSDFSTMVAALYAPGETETQSGPWASHTHMEAKNNILRSSAINSQMDPSLAVTKVQSLLMRGQRTEAVHVAVENKLWAHAMLLATVCDMVG